MMRTLLGSTALRSAAFAALAAGISSPAFAQPAPSATDAQAPENLGQNEVALEAGQDADGSTIVVTGSRIARPNLDSTVPITSVGIQELTNTGEVALGDALNDLPSIRSTTSQQNSSKSSTQSGIGNANGLNLLDLRGLGVQRTLVLVNGRRHVTSTPGAFTVDVNTIPTELVERIDIVTGGNSAIYGSDAVAGVVNFVLKRDFEGIRLRGQTGISSRGDRPTYSVGLTAGKNFSEGRGNVAVSLEYANSGILYNSQRNDQFGTLTGFTNFAQTENTVGEPATGNGIPDTTLLDNLRFNFTSAGGLVTASCPPPPGPSATPAQAAEINARRALVCTGQSGPNGPIGRAYIFTETGSLIENPCLVDLRYAGSTQCVGGLGPTLRETEVLYGKLERKTANLLASYEFSPAARLFLEAKYVDVSTATQGQPTNISGVLSPTVSINNPFLTDQARSLLQRILPPGATTFNISRYNIDFGPQGDSYRRKTYRLVGGLDGVFNDDWRYEVALNYGRFEGHVDLHNAVHVQRFRDAQNAVRNSAGEIVCAINADASTANNDSACVPINLFGRGAPSQAALDYVREQDIYADLKAEQFNAAAFVSGDLSQLFELPGGPIGFALGAEYRRETAGFQYDPLTSTPPEVPGLPVFVTTVPGVLPFRAPALEVKELFGEIRLPLLRDLPLAEELSIDAAGRVSDYNLGRTGTVFAYNVGATYAPIRDIRFRASYAQSVRAPTLLDLYQPNASNQVNGLQDPCSAQFIANNPNRRTNCAAAGVPASELNAAGVLVPWNNSTVSGLIGVARGNPDLKEETSKSWTFGVVAQPRFIPGLSISADYYDITVDDVIFTLGGQTIINLCYDDPTGIDNPYCALVSRRADGTFNGQQNRTIGGENIPLSIAGASFFAQPFNYAKLETSGIDLDVAYRTRLGGSAVLNLRGILSWVEKRNQYPNILNPKFANRIKSEPGDPEWSANFSANLDLGKWDFGYTLRWIGKQTIGAYEAQNSFQGRPPENPDQYPVIWYPDVFYHNFRLGFEPADRFKFYFGVDNLFDKDPPFQTLDPALNGAAQNPVWDNVGRFFYAGVEVKF